MARLIGMDEAGLGPNLGPLVVAVTVWDVPGSPSEFNFWKTFKSVLTNAPEPEESRLHVADSKQVYQSKRGFGALERGVLAALKLLGHEPNCFEDLCAALSTPCPLIPPAAVSVPWYCHLPQALPFETHDLTPCRAWQRCCERKGVKLVTMKAAIIEAHDFNQLIREYDNKSLVVSRVAFQLLRSVWSPDETETLIIGDKHGGRNRYDQLLSEVLDGEMIFRLEEGDERSDYRVGKSLLRFQPRAEEHGPVALASMTAKYVREVAMARFNTFWSSHQEGLKPTQGYPLDARRFRNDIAETQRRLAISDDMLWRCR